MGSPVLVGRDELLALGERRAAAVREDGGHLLFLAGEAGIGKTRLLGALVRQAERHGMASVAGAAFPRDIEIPGSMLLDLGEQLRRSSRGAWAEVGTALRSRLGEAEPGLLGDSHRQRRLLVLDVVAALADVVADGPVVLGLEDLHWADDLTLEVLAQLARRVRELPLLVLATYRSDELYPRIPMREWRRRLLGQRLAEEVTLPRLTLDETAALARFLRGDGLPAPTDLVARLHRRTDGIPLHVEEMLGAVVSASGDGGLPDTLADAVLQRTEGLSPAARAVAESASVIGRTFDLDLLAAVHSRVDGDIGPALAELRTAFFIVDVGRGSFDFRHALIRDAIESSIDPAMRRRLHRRVAEAATARPEIGSDAFLSAHFELAGVPERAFHHARLAAARAAVLSSHREALELSRRALRTAPTSLPPRERAALLRATAAEEAATDDNTAAVASLEEARRILIDAGDRTAAAELVPPLVAARHLLGANLEVRAGEIDRELAVLDAASTEPDSWRGTRARLLAARAAAYMLDRRLDEAIADGRLAERLAAAEGDTPTQLHAATTVGPCLVFAGQMDEGWSVLEQAIQAAREGRREPEEARGYRMLGTSASVLVEYGRADAWLRRGIEFAERTEQWNHRHYMTAHLAHVEWARGAWDAATRLAELALADGRGGVTTTITALHVLGYVALGRGESARALKVLEEARSLASGMRELQRLSPALWGLAECALLTGRLDDAVALTEEGHAASAAVRDAAYLFPMLVTGTRARLAAGDLGGAQRWVATVADALDDRAIPGTLPAVDHAHGLLALAAGSTGMARERLTAAHAAWRQRERWWEGTWAAVDLARCHLRANTPPRAAALLDEVLPAARELRASPILEVASELSERIRVRRGDAQPWAPLSAREFEVARLIADGRTNREIAGELRISPKTVSAHVEHILARLGASRRAEIAAWVSSLDR